LDLIGCNSNCVAGTALPVSLIPFNLQPLSLSVLDLRRCRRRCSDHPPDGCPCEWKLNPHLNLRLVLVDQSKGEHHGVIFSLTCDFVA
jgi:hypothetical protein